MRHILFGDSIGFGVGDYERGGWATQLRLFIDQQHRRKDHNLINLSISGDTTRNMLARMEREACLRMRQDPPEDFTFLIAVGANDSRIDEGNATNNISIDEYRENLIKLVTIATNLSHEVILIGLVPVDETRTAPYKEQKYYTMDQVEKYNEVIRSVASEKHLRFVNFLPDWKNKDLTVLLADGLHPSTEGHQIMFETIKTTLFVA